MGAHRTLPFLQRPPPYSRASFYPLLKDWGLVGAPSPSPLRGGGGGGGASPPPPEEGRRKEREGQNLIHYREKKHYKYTPSYIVGGYAPRSYTRHKLYGDGKHVCMCARVIVMCASSRLGLRDRQPKGRGERVRAIQLDLGEGRVSGALLLGDDLGERRVDAVDVVPADARALAHDRLAELEEGHVEAGLPDEDRLLLVDLLGSVQVFVVTLSLAGKSKPEPFSYLQRVWDAASQAAEAAGRRREARFASAPEVARSWQIAMADETPAPSASFHPNALRGPTDERVLVAWNKVS